MGSRLSQLLDRDQPGGSHEGKRRRLDPLGAIKTELSGSPRVQSERKGVWGGGLIWKEVSE